MKMATAISAWTREEGRRARPAAGDAGPHALDEKPGAHVVLERAAAPLARTHDDNVQPVPGRPACGGAHVDEGRHADRPGLARGEQRPRAVARREVDGPAANALDRELDRRVAEVEPGNRLAAPLTGRERGAPRRGQAPGLGGVRG